MTDRRKPNARQMSMLSSRIDKAPTSDPWLAASRLAVLETSFKHKSFLQPESHDS